MSRNGTPAIGTETLSGGLANFTSPTAPAWLLQTEDGHTHRFRDLTTLQKWVVERRVTREDRISMRGGSARRLGDVEELRPFFEVVELADRARAAGAAAGGAPARPTAPRREQLPWSRVPRPANEDQVTARTASAEPMLADEDHETIDPRLSSQHDDLAAAGLLSGRRRLMIAIGGGFAILALVAAYLGFKDPHGFGVAGGEKSTTARAPSEIAATPAPPPSAPGAAVPAAGAPPGDPAPPVNAPGVPPPAAAPPSTDGVEPTHAEAPSSGAIDPLKPAGPPAEAESARPRTYERLVAEADRALENGQTSKAQKLYEEALKLRPDGVSAMTGSAYLLLDRQRPLAAIGMFKRALSSAPLFPPAIFGLGEAYRAQGDVAHAAEAYRRYLSVAPSGEDASAARRQLRDLGEASPGAGSSGLRASPSSSMESAKIDTPATKPPTAGN